MKFTTAAVSLALVLAGTAHGHSHIQHRRHNGPSQIFTPSSTPASTPTADTPAPTATTSSSTPSSTSASSLTGGSKRGLAFNDVGAAQKFQGKKPSWGYDWASTDSGNLPDGITYIPMLWGGDPDKTGSWLDDANAAISNGAKFVLAMNEPDLGAQSNMDPASAASTWKQFVEPLKGKAALCSPAVTNGGAPMGTAWLDQFLAECDSCTVDCIALHIYDSATNIDYYKNYLQAAIDKYKKPVVVSEFGATGSTSDVTNFLTEMLDWLDGNDGIAAYAFFADLPGAQFLVNPDFSLTSIGQLYADH
ncbi:glycosyl hydrolase catalytic core-domain-containing protein [Abortiporus biennis]|nr:glycosyl hydrolase catalytic core-domain-containing protein [Abortiporus biennis]